MKLLMIAACPFFMARGKPIRVLNNAVGLALLGHHVDLVTYAQGEPIEAAFEKRESEKARKREIAQADLPGALWGIVLHRIGVRERATGGVAVRPGLSVKKLLSIPRLYREAARLAQASLAGGAGSPQPYDALWCHDIDGALIGTRLKKRFGLPLIYDMHGSLRELMLNIHRSAGAFGPGYSVVERYAYRRADVVLANWPHLVPLVQQATDADKVLLVQDKPMLPLIERLMHGEPDAGVKQRLGVTHLLLYTGNFADYQRVDLLLDMMALLKARRVDATLLLAGAGYEAMEARAHALGLGPEHARFVGSKRGEELAELLLSADVALSPRVTENYPPMKVITYIMARTPTVATDLPSHRQMLTNEQTGLLCAPTPDAFADAAERLLDDRPLRDRLRANLAEESQRYSLEALLNELGEVMQRIQPELGTPATSAERDPSRFNACGDSPAAR